MNPLNETVVSPEMMKKLQDSGVLEGYEPVPKELEAKARKLLGGRAVADMDADMKRRLRNRRKAKHRAGVPGY